MDDLRNAMKIIDENSDKLSEGDYLQLCNLLKNVYKQEDQKDFNTLFDYESFNLYVPGQTDEALDHFYDHYFATSIDNDKYLLRSQKSFLEGELEDNKPIQRVSKYVKRDAIRHFCIINDITLPEYTPENLKAYQKTNNVFKCEKSFNKFIQRLSKGYIHIENTYRIMYRGVITDRLERIESWLYYVDNI
jgi:hypothetical protein